MTLKPHRVTGFSLALVVAALLALAPAASARPIDEVGPASLPTQTSKQASPPSQVRVVQVSSDSGFSWGDAGIGAGAAFALTMIGIGGLLLVSNRREHRQATAA
jgi:hypothetical protein